MGTKRIDFLVAISAAVLVGTAGLALASPVPSEDQALRERALALNRVTGEDPIQGQIKALVEDAANTKKLLAVALGMTKEKKPPFNYNGAYILARAALQLKEYDTSRTFYKVCAEQAAKLHSDQKLFQAYMGLRGIVDLLYLDKKYDKSAQLAKEFLEMVEKRGVSTQFKSDILRRLIRALAKQGKSDEAVKMVETLIKARPNEWRNQELKAWLEREKGNYEAAVKIYEGLLSQVTKDETLEKEERTEILAELRLSIIDLLYLDKKYEKSAKLGRELLESLEKQGISARGKAEVVRRIIQSLTQQGKADEALLLFDKLDEKQGQDWRTLELKAWFQRESGKMEDAAHTYEELIARILKDESLDKEEKTEYENDVHYILSGVYVDLGEIDKAAKHLQFLLTREPNNATYNNDLGYIWADHDRNLDEAEKLIRKALDEDRKARKARPDLKSDQDKDNAAYLDSLGWVLFKKKQYAEAKKYLEEAVKDPKEGQHIEIMDHLGDAQMALGEKAAAVETWRKAISLKTISKSKRDQQRKLAIEKKIKAQQ
jgi:tetratricopeptide (TPR) repeat protein